MREVPLTTAALSALDCLPPRIDTVYVFASAGIATPARLYGLRSTFASNALAAGVTTYELARIMGTIVRMIELHYGALLYTAHDAILERLEGADGC